MARNTRQRILIAALLLFNEKGVGRTSLNEIADENVGKLKVCKVDVDANPDVPQKFGIRGIPTLILFKGGNAEATKVGALSKSQLAEFVAEAI